MQGQLDSITAGKVTEMILEEESVLLYMVLQLQN